MPRHHRRPPCRRFHSRLLGCFGRRADALFELCDAEASPGRTYLYHPSRHSVGQPIVAGWDRWTWLVLAAYAQLLLGRGIVADRRLPRERPLPAGSLTPARVLRNFAALLPLVDTPAAAPNPCGRSPGRPKGSLSGPAKRHPAVKKAA